VLEIDDNLVKQRLIPTIEALENEMDFIEPADLISFFNEFGLFIVPAEQLLECDGSTETDHNDN
jgi:hypothetical protein